jgi:carbon-monoxide dehydrogenase large subunit
MARDGIGAAVRRKEDYRFLTGQGAYVDDMKRPGQGYACFARSTRAHAWVKSINIERAAAKPGFIAAFTAADLKRDGLGSLPCVWVVRNKDGSTMKLPPHPLLAVDKVRHVGDPVAVVIGESRDVAQDLADLVIIDYEELPAIVDTASADAEGVAQLHDAAPRNLCFDWAIGDKAAADAAFVAAHHVTKLDFVINRLVQVPMEPRAVLAEYDIAGGRYTLHLSCQNPHIIRSIIASVLKGPESKFRLVAPDVGGGFGAKSFAYAEECIAAWVARKLNRPIKWTAERLESFLTDAQARDHVTHAELALDANGTFLALRASTIANLGGYLSTFAPAIPTFFYATILAGPYRTPAIYCEVKGVFTTTVPVDAYRGAGRPEGVLVHERLIENAARAMGIDRAEIRRRNFIPKESMPYKTPVGLTYDCGDFVALMDEALGISDYTGFDRRQRESQAKGKLRGLGISSFIENGSMGPSKMMGSFGSLVGFAESAELRMHPEGSVTLLTGSHSHGQGHETTFAQVISERLGIPLDKIEVVHGDTDQIPYGTGTYASRSMALGGAATTLAVDKVIKKAKKIAAHMLDAAETDVDFNDGVFTVVGTNKSVGIADVANEAYLVHHFPPEEIEPGLDEVAFYDPKNLTFPNGCHVCEVEIDQETGEVEIVRYVVVDDFGTIINPMIVEGQVHGAIAQGVGQALFENTVYDRETGQLLTGSFMDYCMPRADNVPTIDHAVNESIPCTHNPLGVKGCGESGTIGAPAAVTNAIVDALSPLGITHIDMPATPEKLWRAIKNLTSTSRVRM